MSEKLTEGHLALFQEWRNCEAGEGFNFTSLAILTGVPKENFRPLVRDLAAHGYLRIQRGCFTEEGEPYGTAYVMTPAGRRALSGEA